MHRFEVDQRLSELNDEYTYLVNELIGQGRESDAAAIGRSFERQAAALLASTGNA